MAGPGRHAHAQTPLGTLAGTHRRPLFLGTCFTLSLTENAHPTSQAPEKPLPKANFPTNSQLWAPCQGPGAEISLTTNISLVVSWPNTDHNVLWSLRQHAPQL